MRYLGFDLGTKTLGISISDLTKTIANPYKTIRFNEGDYKLLIEEIKNIIGLEKIEKIVMGLPKNMNNSIGFRGDETLSFKKLLEECIDIEIVMQDERLSTVSAHNYMIEADLSRKKRKTKVDSLAANIILQTYLDKERRK